MLIPSEQDVDIHDLRVIQSNYYYDENGFVENGFITKEAQRKKIEEKIGPIKDMNRRDQVVNVLG